MLLKPFNITEQRKPLAIAENLIISERLVRYITSVLELKQERDSCFRSILLFLFNRGITGAIYPGFNYIITDTKIVIIDPYIILERFNVYSVHILTFFMIASAYVHSIFIPVPDDFFFYFGKAYFKS